MKFERTALVAAALAVVANAQIEASEKFMQNAFTYFADKNHVSTISTELGVPAMHP